MYLTRSYKAEHATVGLIKDYHVLIKKGGLTIMKLDNAIVNGPTIVALQNCLSQKMLATMLQDCHQRHLKDAKSTRCLNAYIDKCYWNGLITDSVIRFSAKSGMGDWMDWSGYP